MRTARLPFLVTLSVAAAIAPAASASAASTTTTVKRQVAAPGTYDVALAITGAARRDAVRVRVGRSAVRRLTVKPRQTRRVRVRVKLAGTKLVARVWGRRGAPKVRMSVRRVTSPATSATATSRAKPPRTSAPAYSTLRWADEFNGSAGTLPSATRWTPQTGDGWGNGAEWQTYTSSARNASQDGAGNLAITARAEPGVGAHGYTSARLTTQNKFSFRYGRLESRMRLPAGKGMWPAFWAMGDDIDTAGWPANGEVDVMESLGHDHSTWYAHIHGPDAANNDVAWGRDLLTPFDLTTGFHTYGVTWSPTSISWTFDGSTVATVKPADLPAGARWVYDHNFHVLLSLAVGGAWPGYPDATTPMPATWLVDWVRVYQ